MHGGYIKSRPKNEDKQSFKTRKLIELINTGIGKAFDIYRHI